MSSKQGTAAAAIALAADRRFASSRLVRRFPGAGIISLSALFGSAGHGSAAEFRTLKISRGRFEQPEITAPAGASLILDVELFGSQDVTVSIPKLRIEPTAVPANRVRIGSVHESSRDLATARFTLGNVDHGEYEILCNGYGRPTIARLIVE
ncbi:MAG: hypothetical protein WAN51_14355 [Alphaproteobacteria bacterium]